MDAYLDFGLRGALDRPDIRDNPEPNVECIHAFRSILRYMDLPNLQIKASAAQTFQSSPQNSYNFSSSLLELMACLLHDVAMNIYEQCHGSKLVNNSRGRGGLTNGSTPPFYHPKYTQASTYPCGPIELIGYWMEMRVFGGVVVFKHDNPTGDRLSTWIHFSFKGLQQLSDAQLNAFSQLGSPTEPAHVDTALPFPDTSPAPVNTQDAYELGLYRNLYEHIPPLPLTNCCGIRRMDPIIYPDSFWEDASKH